MSTQTLTRTHTLDIEAVERKDMPIVASMIRSSADMYSKFVEEDDLEEHYVDTAWEERNYYKRNFFLGYDEDKQAVGTLSLQYFDDFAYVGYLYLDTKFMGRRYGRKFLEFAEQESRENGMDGLYLICHPEAPWAVKAYEKFGFEHHSSDREEILTWNNGCLKGYYEEGFDLYVYRFAKAK